MYHLDNTSGVPEMPEPKEQQSMTPRWFGESQEQGGISWPGADWFNVVQAELLNLLAAAGIEPEKHAYDQLSKAIPVLGDAGLRDDLESEGDSLGGNMIALPWGGTVRHALDKVITFQAMGFLLDGSDETERLLSAIAALEAKNDKWVIEGKGATVTVSQTIYIDLVKVGLRNIIFDCPNPAMRLDSMRRISL